MSTEPPTGEQTQADPNEQAQPAEPSPATSYRVRRAPLYRPFIATGFVLGAVLGVVLAVLGPDMEKFSRNAQAGYLGALFGLLGAALGGFVAVLLDRRAR